MRTPLKRSLILGSALIATLTLGGIATAGANGGQTDRTAPTTSTTSTTADNGPLVETEKGIVLEYFSEAGGREISVTVYENSVYGNFLSIRLGDGLFGGKQTAKALVVDGQLDASVMIKGYPAVLEGTVAENGQPTQIRDSIYDAGQRIVTKGTNTPLLADATLTYRGETYVISFDPAFAYDLEVKKVTLYGR